MDLRHEVKWVQVFPPAARTTANTLYNNHATGTGIDTRDYDEAIIVLNNGAYATDGVVTFTVTAGSAVAGTSSTAITGATLGVVNSVSDVTNPIIGKVRCAGQARYLFIKAVKAGTGAANYGVSVGLYNADKTPYDNSEAFAV